MFGDSVTDCLMANTKNNLKIGFLNPKKKDLLKYYLENFDLVILGEGDFILPYLILQYIVNTHFDVNVINSSLNFDYYKELFKEFN